MSDCDIFARTPIFGSKKGVNRTIKSKKHRQYSGQNKKVKKTNNGQQGLIRKRRIGQHGPYSCVSEMVCSEMVSSSCSIAFHQ